MNTLEERTKQGFKKVKADMDVAAKSNEAPPDTTPGQTIDGETKLKISEIEAIVKDLSNQFQDKVKLIQEDID